MRPLPTFSICFTLFVALTSALSAKITVDVSVETTLVPQVTIQWNDQGNNTVEVVRRDLGLSGIETWTTLDADATSPYVDTTVADGGAYEYSVRSITPTEQNNRFAHFVATLEAPLEDVRGAVLLVVEETWADELSEELKLLELNLAGDGWEVERLDWTREGQGNAEALKTEIQNAVASNPAINSLFIFGAVEMVKSGRIAPDGHYPAHPHETDLFYADLDGNWTDTADQPATEAPSLVSQTPGDGVYDQGHYSSEIDLRTGRVTFHGMGDFKKTEGEYLRDYIHKEHAYRNRHREVAYRNFTGDERHLFAANATLRAMVDDWNDSGSLDILLGDDSYLIAFGSRTGDWTAARDGYQKAIFTTSFRSHRQQWWESNNLLRAMLTQPDWGLTALWGGRPAWYLHKLAAGKPIGQSVIDTQNDLVKPLYDVVRDPETGVYSFPQARDYEFRSDDIPRNYVTNNLLGDPTLRISHVEPVTELTLARTGPDDIRLSWSPSPATELIGYHVYSSSDRRGPFTRMTADLITSTELDASAPAGADRWFQVRAVAIVTVPTGRYVDQSHGRFALAYADGSVNTPPVAQDFTVTGKVNTPVYLTFPGADADGDALTPVFVDNPDDGQIRWWEGRPFYVSKRDETGTDTATYVLFDGVTVSEPATITFTATDFGDTLLAWELPDGSTSNPSPTFLHPSISSTEIVAGPGTNIISAWPGTDSFTSRFIDSTISDSADYFHWTVSPEDGKRMSLSRINLGICGATNNVITYELRASIDGFETYEVIPMELGTITGRGLGGNAGILDSADCSVVAILQNQDQPVTFRLHFADTAGGSDVVGIGKITDPVFYDAIEDVSFLGTVTSATGAPFIQVTETEIGVPEAGTATVQVSLSAPPAAPLTLNIAKLSGDADLNLSTASTLQFDANSWNMPQAITFEAAYDADTVSSGAVFEITGTGLETVVLNVTEVDTAQPPVAVADIYEMEVETSLSVNAPGVLGNDTDANDEPLTAELVSGPSHGDLVFNADGSFTFTPEPGFSGSDSFTYRADDGTLESMPATVSLGVVSTTIRVSVFGNVDHYTPEIYVSGQYDNAETTILGSRQVEITGNGWFMLDLTGVDISADTVLAFDFTNQNEGEIHGIGFDTDSDLSPDTCFQFAGSQDWGDHNFDDYDSQRPETKHYQIPVGQYYTGNYRYLYFAHDDDDNIGAVATFANLRIYNPNALTAWADAMGLDIFGARGMNDDANADGKTNLYHFAFATHPLTQDRAGSRMRIEVDRDGSEGSRPSMTIPVRAGAVFSGNPPTSALIDGVVYTVYADFDLSPPLGDATMEEVPAQIDGLPTLEDFDGVNGADWEYRTFRVTSPMNGRKSVFLWIGAEQAE